MQICPETYRNVHQRSNPRDLQIHHIDLNAIISEGLLRGGCEVGRAEMQLREYRSVSQERVRYPSTEINQEVVLERNP